MTPAAGWRAGEVGYVITGIKDVALLRVGDTLTDAAARPPSRCPATGRSSRWSSAASSRSTPTATRTFATRSSGWRSTTPRSRYEPETSQALGFGFRCGFLGLLHMEIVRERLEREYDLELLATTPNVRYEVRPDRRRAGRGSQPGRVARPGGDRADRRAVHPRHDHHAADYVGAGDGALPGPRGTHIDMHYLSPQRVQLRYDLPLAEIVLDFYDQLKSRTKGYASPTTSRSAPRLRPGEARRPAAGDPVDALS